MKTAKRIRQELGYFTQKEMAQHLRVDYHILRGWVKCGLVPAPTATIGASKRRYYTDADLYSLDEEVWRAFGPKVKTSGGDQHHAPPEKVV